MRTFRSSGQLGTAHVAERQIHRPMLTDWKRHEQAVAACGDDAREAVKALIVADGFWKPRSLNFKPPFRTATRAASLRPIE